MTEKAWLTMERVDGIRRGVIHVETEGGIELTNRFKDQMCHAHQQWVIWRKASDQNKDRAEGWRAIAITLFVYMALSSDFVAGLVRGLGVLK